MAVTINAGTPVSSSTNKPAQNTAPQGGAPVPPPAAPKGPALSGEAQKSHNDLVLSYLKLRRMTGLLGFVLPMLLLIMAATPTVNFMPSISEFYYTPVRSLLVGVIGAIAIFLFCYKGYSAEPDRVAQRPIEKILTDRRVSMAAALGAIGVAMFPTSSQVATTPVPLMVQWLGSGGSALLHALSALTFFLALAVMCLENFRRAPLGRAMDRIRTAEHSIYSACGNILVGCTAILVLLFVIGAVGRDAIAHFVAENHLIFWFETFGLLAFSVAWLVKGEGLTSVVKLVATADEADRIRAAQIATQKAAERDEEARSLENPFSNAAASEKKSLFK